LEEGLRLLTKDEISDLASALLRDWRVRVLRWGISIAALIGVFAAALFLNSQAGKRLRETKEIIERTFSNEVERAYSAATNQTAREFQVFVKDANNQIAQAYSSVTNQIADQFQTPRIKQTIENVAKSQARSMLEAEVQPVVEHFRSEVEQKLEALTSEQDFLGFATRARANDYQAYLRLLRLEPQTNTIGRGASLVVQEIDRELEAERSSTSYRQFWTVCYLPAGKLPTFYKGPFASDEIATALVTRQDPRTREALVNAVRDLKQPLLLESLMQLLEREDDLVTADRIALAISELTKEDFHAHDFDRIESWWKEHKASFL